MFPVSDVIPPRTRPVVTVALIALTSAVFLYELQLDRPEMYALARAFGVVPGDVAWSHTVTGAFLHDGWLHFAGNMLYLWLFGGNVEDSLGHAGFAVFYLAASAAGAATHAFLHASSMAPLIGASSAIAAILGAYFVLYPRSQVLTAVFLVLYLDVIEVPAVIFLAVWLILQLLASVFSMGAAAADGGLALGAHLSGFAVGAVTGIFLRHHQTRRGWDRETP
jgi:membrane associated rhomboid family serine protease